MNSTGDARARTGSSPGGPHGPNGGDADRGGAPPADATVVFGCAQCGRAVETAPGATVTCARCGAASTAAPSGPTLERCLACGCEELYRHRDFNQKVGLLIIVAGALLWAVFGSFWPMVAAAALDLVLYLTLPDVAICYRCKAHHRDFANVGALPAFDLERHEHHRFAQARERRTGGDAERPERTGAPSEDAGDEPGAK